MELFSSTQNSESIPLAARMRPETLDEFIGQEHIVGKGRLLRRAIQADQLSSVIFYGPPGTGKTTLARIIANTTKSSFITINAVLSGVKEIREAIIEAKKKLELYEQKTILFVDEVHRWNKAQQDALLPWVENGTFILIGATTENPFFEVNSALVSRSRIFQLLPLSDAELIKTAEAALKDPERGYGKYNIEFEEGALEHIAEIAAGDARSLLNALELAVETTPESFPPAEGERIYISMETAEESIQKKAVLYDKEGDYHYDTISAFIKSIRGSDPDAALYWMARMVDAGEDPKYIFRRMLISAAEDIGMADPNALTVVNSAVQAFERIGMPEGNFFLSQAALYLSTAKKSNTALSFFDALEAVRNEKNGEVPDDLKDSSRDKHSFGHGKGYLYPHAYKDHWVAQQYLPDTLKGRIFYQPGDLGYESEIKTDIARKREAQLEASLEREDENTVLTFTPPDRKKDEWLKRTADSKNEILTSLRELIFKHCSLNRHSRVLVAGKDKGLLLWEALRKVPEGGVWTVLKSREEIDFINNYPTPLHDTEKPIILEGSIESLSAEREPVVPYDAVIGRNIIEPGTPPSKILKKIYDLLESEGIFSIAEALPGRATKLSELISEKSLTEEERKLLTDAEEEVYRISRKQGLSDSQELLKQLEKAGFANAGLAEKEYMQTRIITGRNISRWLDLSDPGSYGSLIKGLLPDDFYSRLSDVFYHDFGDREIKWRTVYLFLWGLKR